MRMRMMLAAVVMVGLGVVAGLAVGEERGADTRGSATGPATTRAGAAASQAATEATGKVGCFGVETKGASRVVYVVDHSGSLLDSMDFIRGELLNSIEKLVPAQRFAVVGFSETVDRVFPKDGKWMAAKEGAAQDFKKWIVKVKAQGENDDLLDPYVGAFKQAMTMAPRPEVVYFLTDGNFDPGLPTEVRKMNAGKKVKIHTFGIIKITREAEDNLKRIAQDSGGTYKWVGEKDLEGLTPLEFER